MRQAARRAKIRMDFFMVNFGESRFGV